jgi:hypothetical protein
MTGLPSSHVTPSSTRMPRAARSKAEVALESGRLGQLSVSPFTVLPTDAPPTPGAVGLARPETTVPMFLARRAALPRDGAARPSAARGKSGEGRGAPLRSPRARRGKPSWSRRRRRERGGGDGRGRPRSRHPLMII